MSAMLGSPRRDSRPRLPALDAELELIEKPAGTLRALVARLLTRLELLFSPPPESRP